MPANQAPMGRVYAFGMGRTGLYISELDARFTEGALALSETAARRALIHVARTAHARAVPRRHGNMSSANILFVLEEALRAESPVPGELGVMIGLGPGFAAEGALR
jgi:predicted naringenin-chalcone synthase